MLVEQVSMHNSKLCFHHKLSTCSSVKYLQRSFTGGRVDSPSTSTSPVSSSPRNFLQRSCSILRTPATNSQQMATLRHAEQRLTRCWSQAIAQSNTMDLGLQEVKRQEVLYISEF